MQPLHCSGESFDLTRASSIPAPAETESTSGLRVDGVTPVTISGMVRADGAPWIHALCIPGQRMEN